MKDVDYLYNILKGRSETFGKLRVQCEDSQFGKKVSVFVKNTVTTCIPHDRFDYVLVFGYISEKDGFYWIYEGKWRDDFEEIINEKQREQERSKKAEEKRIKTILANY